LFPSTGITNINGSSGVASGILKVGPHGERAEREPIGGLGAEPPVGSRGKAPGGGQGAKPPVADDIFIMEHLILAQK
jgi:hypothetical protein